MVELAATTTQKAAANLSFNSLLAAKQLWSLSAIIIITRTRPPETLRLQPGYCAACSSSILLNPKCVAQRWRHRVPWTW
jgi:hypothetical protein